MQEERKKLLDSILEESKKMIIEKTWPVTEDELVEHSGISGSFEFGFLCDFLHCKKQIMKDAVSGYWIARDKNVARPLNIFEEKPEREHLNDGRQYWKGDFHDSICLPSTLFPEIQWENEPQKVKLKIINDE